MDDDGVTYRGLERAEHDPRLREALTALPRRQRAVLVLRYHGRRRRRTQDHQAAGERRVHAPHRR
ncbi:hypothetical protein [Actinomadura chokoriensis]|uniref:Uncharacterized protein n=1 Tax=Actinomadura chokoriensis TaxID=454156 RepID=A0ABV4QWG1_9ACTN